jgi:hypothetical protein
VTFTSSTITVDVVECPTGSNTVTDSSSQARNFGKVEIDGTNSVTVFSFVNPTFTNA